MQTFSQSRWRNVRPAAFETTLKWVGVAYLAWLGVQTWRSSRQADLPHAVQTTPSVGVPNALREVVVPATAAR